MTVLAEYPLQALLFGVGQLEMGMELYIALAIRALLHLDPKMMKNIPFDAIHHGSMQRCNELGDLIANLLDFRVVIPHPGGGQLKSGNKGRDRVDVKTNHPGVAAHGLHQTCPAADEGIENDSAMHGGLTEIGIPKGVGLVRGKGQRGDDRTELGAHPSCKPAVDPVQRIRALTFTQGKLGDLGNGNVARLQQGTGRPTAKGVALRFSMICFA
ncbi:hypothetical protein RDSD_000559 [Oleidesulfovibrio alaskensis]